jgi:hypothetical protein
MFEKSLGCFWNNLDLRYFVTTNHYPPKEKVNINMKTVVMNSHVRRKPVEKKLQQLKSI